MIRTELNYIRTRAAADSIISAEMGYYQFIAVMDNRTTPICQSLDGEIFPIIELSQGENAPPMHVRCRSTIAASEDDGKQGRKPVGQRAARDEDGKRIKIPADMTYRDWKAVYIDKTRTLEDWRTEKIKSSLQSIMLENRIRGEIVYPPPKLDVSKFKFDAEHTQGDKHPHNVTEEEARRFVSNAYFTIVKYNGNSYNYYGREGAAFVRMDLQTIRTAFKSDEYDEKVKKLIGVFENE
ncbi:MAG: minor capsid protein [Selenomonadaceae bacterium]|nr:minor capsid protein [Selenomonadaceae bacterium]